MTLERMAHHEAGHAVAAVVLDTGLISVDIIPKPIPGGGIGVAGAFLNPPPNDRILGKGEESVMPYLITFLAGWIAEQVIEPAAKIENSHPQSDGQMVRRYAIGAICTPVTRDGRIISSADEQRAYKDRIDALETTAESETRQFVNRYKAAIAAVASALLSRQQLVAREVQKLVSEHPPNGE